MSSVGAPDCRRYLANMWPHGLLDSPLTTEDLRSLLSRYKNYRRRSVQWFTLVRLLCGSKEQKCLECSLSDSWKRGFLLCRFRRRFNQNLIIFCMRRTRKRRISSSFCSCNNILTLNTRSSEFGRHHAWWIWWYIYWRRQWKLPRRRSLKLQENHIHIFDVSNCFFMKLVRIWSRFPQTTSLFD